MDSTSLYCKKFLRVNEENSAHSCALLVLADSPPFCPSQETNYWFINFGASSTLKGGIEVAGVRNVAGIFIIQVLWHFLKAKICLLLLCITIFACYSDLKFFLINRMNNEFNLSLPYPSAAGQSQTSKIPDRIQYKYCCSAQRYM